MEAPIFADQEHLTIKGQTLPISSLRFAKTHVKRRELGLFSHLFILASGIAFVNFWQLPSWCKPIGYVLVLVAWIWIHEKYLQISYSVKVVSYGSEEFEVLNTKDDKYADQIEEQINQAIKSVSTPDCSL